MKNFSLENGRTQVSTGFSFHQRSEFRSINSVSSYSLRTHATSGMCKCKTAYVPVRGWVQPVSVDKKPSVVLTALQSSASHKTLCKITVYVVASGAYMLQGNGDAIPSPSTFISV
jgi:hypothetical protein